VAAFIGAVALTFGSGTMPTLARFTRLIAPSGTFSTDTLAPPTGLSASGGASVSLAWTPTVSTYAAGYNILRSTTSGSGYAQVGTATPRSASSYTDAPAAGTYYYVLTSYDQNWLSVQTAQVSASVNAVTGFKPCTAQAADTGGDGDGYELNPANGCADDGLSASDVSSGTNTKTTCTDTGKDRHRFSVFGLGLPGAVTSINGISLKVKLGANQVSGVTRVCAELSWDGGTSWTAAQTIDLSATALTYYTLGGATSLWGRTWTVGNFSDASFVVRLTDASNSSVRTFQLDTVQVQVTYTP
jgi:hypothetical protein